MTSLIPMATFNVSGVAMTVISDSELCQTGGWDGTAEADRARTALSTARRVRMGAGETYIVIADLQSAGVIWDYCWTTGSTLVQDPDPDTRRDGRALLAVAERVEICCVKSGWGKPTKDHGPVPPPGETPRLHLPPAVGQPEEPVLMSQQQAHVEALRRNAAGEVGRGNVAEPQPYPADARDGEEDGWLVAEVATSDASDPVRDRRNTAPLRDPKHWSAQLTTYALLGSPGEPIRTWEDMRLALSGQMQRYLDRFPDPAGVVDDGLAYRTASLIAGDHYQVPGMVIIQRGHLLAYVAKARERQQST